MPLATIARVLPDTQLTPRQIFRLFDHGSLSREQLREALKTHALELIDEMEDVHQNPSASWLESMVNKHHAARLTRMHGEPIVREVMLALSEIPGFAPGRWLWNADHADVPLHCFLRSRRAPLFRVMKITSAPFVLTALIEHSDSRKEQLHREHFTFERDRFGVLNVTGRTLA